MRATSCYPTKEIHLRGSVKECQWLSWWQRWQQRVCVCSLSTTHWEAALVMSFCTDLCWTDMATFHWKQLWGTPWPRPIKKHLEIGRRLSPIQDTWVGNRNQFQTGMIRKCPESQIWRKRNFILFLSLPESPFRQDLEESYVGFKQIGNKGNVTVGTCRKYSCWIYIMLCINLKS